MIRNRPGTCRALIAALLTVCFASSEEGAQRGRTTGHGGKKPGPRESVAGVSGFQAELRLIYPDFPQHPQRLVTVYLFPDRARWLRQIEGSGAAARDLQYRFGDRVHLWASGAQASAPVAEPDRTDMLIMMELVRAAMIWPDGFAWGEQDAGGVCEAPLGRLTGSVRKAGNMGFLRARVDREGRAREIAAFRADASARDRLELHGWRELQGRWWPARFDLFLGKSHVFSAELLSAETRVDYLDLFFLPPDRRDAARFVTRGAAAYALDIPSHAQRSVALEGELDWKAALQAHAALREAAGRELDCELDSAPSFELDAAGRPRAALLRLRDPAATLPEGFERVPAGPGFALLRLGTDQLDRRQLIALGKHVPSDARAGIPYATVVQAPRGLQLNVILPLWVR